MATVKKIKKYQNSGAPLKSSSDSSAYYKNLDKKYAKASNDAYKKHDVKGSFSAMSEAMKASANAERQKLKGKPGYDANGFPIKKNKTGGVTKAKDGKWIQKATASIKKRGTAGKCTPITKKGCSGKAKTLALTFKKMAKARKGK